MLISVHPKNPQANVMDSIAKELRKGKVYILPTDTVYAFVTCPTEKKSIERLYNLKSIPVGKQRLSLYCRDFSQASKYIRMAGNQAYRWLKSKLPGPYTLIFQASKELPQYTMTKQKTVGIRIIDHPVIVELLKRLDTPLIGTSVFTKDEYLEYPDQLEKNFGKLVDGIVDCGPIEIEMSTVLDMQEFPPEVIRLGKGKFDDSGL